MKTLCALFALTVSASAAAQSYVRTRVPDKENLCLFWPSRKYVYNVDPAGSQRTPGTSEFPAIDAAFQTWTGLSATCSEFAFEKGQPARNVVVEYRQNATDNENVITFRETSCNDVAPVDDACWTDGNCGNKYKCWDNGDLTIALTTTTFSFRTGFIFDADIELNAAPHAQGDPFLFTSVNSPPCDETAIAPTCVATDIQNTLTHEVGHVIGLDHSPAEGSTMEATAPIGETKKRALDQGTAQGFCSTYPRSGPTPACDETGSSVRRIVAESRGSPGISAVTGCASAPGLFTALALLVLGGLGRRFTAVRRR